MSDLAGKTILVSGASSGIGFEASIALAKRGAYVAMVARDRAKAEAALAEVKKRSGSEKFSLFLHGLSLFAEVRKLAEAFKARYPQLDVLVNNAGGVSDKRRVTADGFEQTFAVNHLAPFLLTHLLLDRLQASAPTRVVIVASIGHRRGTMDFDNLQYENGGYAMLPAYCRSKLANVLARRMAGKGVISNCLHPGTVATGIWSKGPWFALPLLAVGKLFMISAEKGGGRVVHLAASPEVTGTTGAYFEKNQPVKPSRLARDEALAKRLWETSEKLVGIA